MSVLNKGEFEGLYLKHQIGDRVFSFIISVHKLKNKVEHACIQFITNEGVIYEYFSMEDTQIDMDCFHIKIGKNRFNSDGCRVHMKSEDMDIACNIKYGPFTTLESDIMGPFRRVPNMQCKHKIISMTHQLRGFIDINGEAIELTGGTGYIEGDRGYSFPKKYMWSQCNFKYKGDHSIVLACAEIPLPIKSFEGVFCQIFYRGKNYRLATYNGAKILQKTNKSISIKQGDMRVYIMFLDKGGHRLRIPEHGEMKGYVRENPAGRVRYVFYNKDNKIFDFVSRCGSFESYNGEGV